MTYIEHNPDSWEGWQWGGDHMWGFSTRLGIPEQYDLLEDALKHCEMMVFWSSDPETTGGVYGAHESTIRRQWLKELGVKMVFIDPYFNHTAGLVADKWLAPRMGTDVALGLGIAFVWLTEGLVRPGVCGHPHPRLRRVEGLRVGRERRRAQDSRLGGGRVPAYPAREIRALAREWAAKKTMLAAGGMGGWGGACRSSYGNEYARTMIALAAMQGLGKPGSNIYSTTGGVPADRDFWFPGYSEGGISADIGGYGGGLPPLLAHVA